MIAAQHKGGLVLGAYDGRRMVGVLFGFPGLDGKKVHHYSHITGVRREYQNRGVGFKLKLAQRQHVLRQGLDLVRWTYDPLQAGNAYFNIRKLGGICRTYQRNFYGSLNDSLNRGRITDRFEVEWWLKTRRVRRRLGGESKNLTLLQALSKGAEVANQSERMGLGVRKPTRTVLNLQEKMLLVEIPENIVKVREASLEIARRWTMIFRKIFENYFGKGYAVTDVIVDTDHGERRIFYLLESNVHR
jgi:predicted GNAT superfamily acetyltransferase